VAIYHLSLKVGAKGKAAPHFNYISASEKYAAKRGVVHVEHGNMPMWAMADPALFWQASDAFERANGTAYRELEVSLPRELPLEQQIELARQLASEACGDNHAFSLAIHHAKARDGDMNPHIHLEFSERIDDGIERDPKHYFKRANKKQPEKGDCCNWVSHGDFILFGLVFTQYGAIVDYFGDIGWIPHGRSAKRGNALFIEHGGYFTLACTGNDHLENLVHNSHPFGDSFKALLVIGQT